MSRVTAIITAKHVNGASVTHDCHEGYLWRDPVDGYRLAKDFPSEHAYKNGIAELKRQAMSELANVCSLTGHCKCRKLIKPRADWLDSVKLEVAKHATA